MAPATAPAARDVMILLCRGILHKHATLNKVHQVQLKLSWNACLFSTYTSSQLCVFLLHLLTIFSKWCSNKVTVCYLSASHIKLCIDCQCWKTTAAICIQNLHSTHLTHPTWFHTSNTWWGSGPGGVQVEAVWWPWVLVNEVRALGSVHWAIPESPSLHVPVCQMTSSASKSRLSSTDLRNRRLA